MVSRETWCYMNSARTGFWQKQARQPEGRVSGEISPHNPGRTHRTLVIVLGTDATSSRSSEWQTSKTNEDPVTGKQEQEPVPLLVFSRPPAWVSTCPRAGRQAVVHGHQSGFRHLLRRPQYCMCAVKGGHWYASSCDLECLPPQHPGCPLSLLLDCFKTKLAAIG